MTTSLDQMSPNLQSALVEMAFKAVEDHVGKHATRERAAAALDTWKANEALNDELRARVLAGFFPASVARP